MSGLDFDTIDTAIVRELQADGRLAYESLAGRVGLSRAAARLRVRRLLANGSIRVVGVVHPAVRSIGASAHLSISTAAPGAPVAAAVAEVAGVTHVALAVGRVPLVAEVRGRDLAQLAETVDLIRTVGGVRAVDTFVYTQVLKDPGLPHFGPPTAEPDPVDLHLLKLLQDDGRSSFAELAGRVGLSAGAVRSRVLRLLDGGVVRVTALVDPMAAGHRRLGGFALRVDGEAGCLDDTAAEIASWDHSRSLARGLGRADLMGTFTARSTADLITCQERLRALPGVSVLDTWTHVGAAGGGAG
ncbi:DNA-binding Lrp family transcriptional regulator [Murinocardiopsis flavida]|uniref:DNA-binding Lrp family transcriptional regulator n=1 Tax=Murinocardiopsis flavida TaxID=645275 RepID=A0A2P8DHA8_9ACTN|nr:Lrp/AsnC family transcriptional regulator [Murinocardiopsis flavida]PSK96601.1 DNA-binding Lrp family transcriptional regulator [Murinocardiopsis flavida]